MKIESSHGSVDVTLADGQGLVTDLTGDGMDGATMAHLLGSAESYCKEQGCTHIYAHVGIQDERLLKVYKERWGMEPVGTILRKEL